MIVLRLQMTFGGFGGCSCVYLMVLTMFWKGDSLLYLMPQYVVNSLILNVGVLGGGGDHIYIYIYLFIYLFIYVRASRHPQNDKLSPLKMQATEKKAASAGQQHKQWAWKNNVPVDSVAMGCGMLKPNPRHTYTSPGSGRRVHEICLRYEAIQADPNSCELFIDHSGLLDD